MADILQEVLKKLDDNKEISSASFEAANIILYTKNKEFFIDNKGRIRELVNEFKKRIELRPDPKLSISQEKAEKAIREILPTECNVAQIIFEVFQSSFKILISCLTISFPLTFIV